MMLTDTNLLKLKDKTKARTLTVFSETPTCLLFRPVCAALLLWGAFSQPAFAVTNILSNRYDNNRTAANLTETTLSPTTVNANSFGKLWSYWVDGAVFAQPLYVQGVTVTGASAPKNVLYVATMHDVVYAFDADNPGNPLWTHDYRATGITPGTPFDPTTASNGMGIIGTPAIDAVNNKMYLVAETMENGNYVQRLHVLDIRSGVDLGAVVISATFNGIAFNPEYQSQRPGLALADGQVWLAFGSTIPGDFTPWQGWVITYNATTLAQTGAFATATSGGGIWHSGGAPVIDAAGNVYYVTGNGTGQAYDGVNNFQESLLQFTYNGGLKLNNWYTDANWSTLDNYDLDLTAGGPLLVPGTDLVAVNGKIGLTNLLHTGKLGHLTANNAQVAQSIQTGPVPNYTGNDGDRIIGLAYWQRPTNPQMYAWPGLASLTSYTFNGTTFKQNQQNNLNLFGEPGAALSLSANGTTVGSGILWVARNQAAGRIIGQASVLEAYNADNISSLLWSSTNDLARDDVGSSGRFVIPVVNNGKVYMATANDSVQVYGLNPPASEVWTECGVNVDSIAAGSDGTVLVTNNANQGIWKYNADNNWTNIAGALKAVAVVKNNTYFGIGTDNNVYRYTGTGWVKVGVNVDSIAAASDGTVLVTNNANQSIWKYVSDNNWVQIPGTMKSLAVVSNGNYFGIGTDNNIYRYTGSGWVEVGANADSISAGSDGTVLAANNGNQGVWQYVADNAWVEIQGTLKSLAVVKGDVYFAIGADNNVYRH